MATHTEPSRTIHVFIASPGDLAVERRAFKKVIDKLNGGFGDGAGVKFVGLGWEDTLASTGRRSQAVINLEIDRSDVFVLTLNRRWGQEAPDAMPYTSYTEEEFHRAMDRWKNTGSPEIFVFFKHMDAASMADPGPQLQKVLAFRKSLEDSRQVLYHFFADEKQFTAEVDQHLRAYAKGELPKPDAPHEAVLLPLKYVQAVEQEKLERQRAEQRAEREHQQAEAANARADALALELAEQAAKAALDGRAEEARQTFAKAHQGTTNLRVLYLAYEFYKLTGDLGTAEEMVERRLAISGRDAETWDTARALGNLGLICFERGELGRAEELHKNALAIDEKLGNQEGIARHFSNLGVIYLKRSELECSELERAEEMFKKALAIDEKRGSQERIARHSSNLGLVYRMRGELDWAEEMHQKALAIAEKLPHQMYMADQYGNLGLVYGMRGQLDRAEEILEKALAINEKLGRQAGMASDNGSLGSVAKDRGDVDRARKLWSKARDLYAKIGMPHMVKQAQGCLDALPKE